jgi:hypothetical protein
VVFVFDWREVAPGLTSLLILIHVQVPSLAPVHRIEVTPAWHRDKTVNAGKQPGAQACTGDTPLFAFMDLPRGRGRERRRGRERLGKQRRGTKTHDCGYRLSQSDRSIGSALRQDARAFPYRVPACFLPSQIVLVLVVVLVLGPWFEAWHRDKTANAGRQPGAQACTGDTHLFAFMDLPRGRGRERRRGRERLGRNH